MQDLYCIPSISWSARVCFWVGVVFFLCVFVCVCETLLAGFQPAASGSAGIAAASQTAWDLCGTGAFRRSDLCVCVCDTSFWGHPSLDLGFESVFVSVCSINSLSFRK